MIETSKKIPITVFDETIEDALLAKELMLKQANIDQNNIFILGHSLGGMLAPRIDQMGGEFKGIIIMAGSPRSLRVILQEQTEDSIKTMNKFLQLIAKKQIKKLNEKLDLVDSVSEEEAKKAKMIGGTTLWYFQEMEKFDLKTTLKELRKPIFIVQGANDLQVSAKRDFKLYQAICHDNECITLKLYPNLNHLFMPSIYNDINKLKKEYKIAAHVDETVLVDICNFILSKVS